MSGRENRRLCRLSSAVVSILAVFALVSAMSVTAAAKPPGEPSVDVSPDSDRQLRAASCNSSDTVNEQYSGSMGIVASPGLPNGFKQDIGVNGYTNVSRNYFKTSKDVIHHTESVYLWWDPRFAIEYGWYWRYSPIPFTGSAIDELKYFTYLNYPGESNDVNHNHQNATVGNRKFGIVWPGTGASGGNYRFNFHLDGVNQPYTEQMPFNFGHPNAAVEIKNQCQDGHGGWWSLQRMNLNRQWKSWTNLHWDCDGMRHFGFDWKSSTSFTSSARADTVTGNVPGSSTTFPPCEHMY